jgi:UDP-N-acetylmuramoylalanine--D-glutamate ligase
VEHRIEFVCERDGVRYVNDSKGTNPDSTVKAVESIVRPTVLLLGGSNKNSDYTPVFNAFSGRVKAVVAYGFTRDQIERDAKKTGYSPIYICDGVSKKPSVWLRAWRPTAMMFSFAGLRQL